MLSAMPVPCYVTAADVRKLRAPGTDLASMGVVSDAILATYHRMRVATIACIAHRGGGLRRGEPSLTTEWSTWSTRPLDSVRRRSEPR